jgi:ABC-type transport system involved in multi-copper enzyme maturation permease subunit
MATEATALRSGVTGTWGVLRGEVRRWLGWRGLFHLILWLIAIELILYQSVTTKAQPFGWLGFESLMNMLVIVSALVGIVLTAAAVCGSYHDGTTSWELSKPVPRSGYVAATVGGLWLGVAATTIVVPGLVAYWWLPKVEPYRFVTPEAPPLGRFLVAIGLIGLVLAFFMGLTAFLSALIRRRSAAVILAAWVLLVVRVPFPYTDWMDYTPARLIRTDIAQGGWAEFTEYIYAAPFDAMPAVTGTLGLTAAFVLAATVVFRRLEL